ncbi:hypothetical protein [Roseicella sp. DB1501]|uniref:hypothetical protein n=1 Tax=Roseicella sp. DB1501 TaxID=2730925 RepID=UPI0014921182|nr:hypothetical protein [Roseicella sp. DB1501]NOG71704.1 hypothetical protein [Roseicella sp. DB1501]
MSETPETPAGAPASAPAPTPRNSPLDPPAPKRLDPAAVMIGVGGVVLLLAVWWLLKTPRSTNEASVDPARVAQLEQRLGALEGVRGELGTLGGRLQALAPLEGRVQALENKPAPQMPDLRPLESQVAALAERTAVAERSTAQATDRVAANERRLQALEAKPTFDPAAVAPRVAFDALGTRVEAQATRLQQLDADLTRRLQEAQRADEQREQAAQQALTQKLQEAQRADEQREQAAQQALTQKLQDAARVDEQREQAAQQQMTQRLQALEQTVQQKLAALDSALGQRVAALEQAQKQMQALESRTARLAAVDRLRGALGAGQPLGEALARIDQPPQALARFAQAAPPTEAALRLSFEDAAKAARAASDAAMQPDGSKAGVMDSAMARLGGLVTIRRGDQVVWGDAAEAEIERARRALEAGDIEMSLQHIDRLPPPARQAMQGWADQARSLLAARAALRQLAAG